MASSDDNLGDLTSAHFAHLEAMASRLEDAWKNGPADLNAILPPPEDPFRRQALLELIKVDMECRWRRGQPVVLDYYVDKFKDLGPQRSLPAGLIFEEYRVRIVFGDKPPLELYRNRFPIQYPIFEKLLNEQPLPTIAPPVKTRPDQPPSKKSTSKSVAPSLGLKDNVLTQTGGYKMVERLGAGAFGEVWRVEAPGGVPKAIKIIFRPLDDEEAQREQEAANLVKTLRHHFLMPTHSFWPSEDRLCILMDLADCSLRDRLKECKKEGKLGIPSAEMIKHLRCAAEALDYLHEKGVQHRDIKPENILLSEGSARVADFGLARHQATRRLASGSGAGTPLYMPPEAWQDKVHINSDQYSLAATYAECRLGRRIYQVEGLASLMQAHLHDRPNLDSLFPDEQKVLHKALAKNPDERYESCIAFADALEVALSPHLPLGTVKFNPATMTGGMDVGGETLLPSALVTMREGQLRLEKQKAERRFLLAGAASILLLAAVIWAAFLLRGTPLLESEVVAEQSGVVGETLTIPVRFTRTHFNEPVQLAVKDEVGDLDVPAVDLPSDESVARVTITVRPDATLGKRTIMLKASGGDQAVDVAIPLDVRPLYTSRAGVFRPVPGTPSVVIGGRSLFKQIECHLTRAPSLRVRFNLIPWEQTGKQPFYLMEDMVWNSLYAQFADDDPGAVNGSRWRLGARTGYCSFAPALPVLGLLGPMPTAAGWLGVETLMDNRIESRFLRENWPQPTDLGVSDGQWPVLRVDIQEAHRCCEWLGGVLPSAEQWDKAAGRFEPNFGLGPFIADFGPGQIAVGREGKGPMPVGQATKDISRLSGCRDMAGNGLEWTRTLLFDQESREFTGDLNAVNLLTKVALRGRDFNHAEPLLFSDLAERPVEVEFWMATRKQGSDASIGFRAALLP